MTSVGIKFCNFRRRCRIAKPQDRNYGDVYREEILSFGKCLFIIALYQECEKAASQEEQERHNPNLEKLIHPKDDSTLFTTAKIWKQPKCPSTHEWIKKMWCLYVCMCVCIYMYIYTYICLYSHIYTHT